MNKARQIAFYALFTALIICGSFVKIPMPLVPVTLQMFFCFLCAMTLGWKGVFPVLLYIISGLCGLPFFATGGGFFYVLRPTFGYLLGFIFGVMFLGLITKGKSCEKCPSIKQCVLSCFAALLVVYLCGLPYFYCIMNFYIGTPISVKAALISGFLIFLPTDILWCVLSSFVSVRLNKTVFNKCV